jgi:NADPH:quinone reductase-like Zn-dependent oxidoreductase
MTTYSAWFATKKGHPAQSLQLKTDLPIPAKPAKGHVLVKVQAVGLNPVYCRSFKNKGILLTDYMQ